MFPMTVTIHNALQLNAVLAVLGGKADPTPAAAKPVTAAVQKEAAKPAADAPARTLDEAKRFTVKLAGKHREPVVKLLGEYGVAKAAELPAEKVTAYVVAIEALAKSLEFAL